MRIIYFSGDYTPHDHRFLSALSSTRHEVFYLRLERRSLQVEDRPVPARIQQIRWAGGRGAFRWRDVPTLVRDLRRVISEIKPDLIHAGPIQTCAFLAILSGFRPVLTMSWGFDLMQDAELNAWWRWVTRYTLSRSTYFASDAQVTRDRAVSYGMRPDRTSVFPWGVDLSQFRPDHLPGPRRQSRSWKTGSSRRSVGERGASRERFVLFCNRSWEPRYGVDVLAKAFTIAARERANLSLILLGAGSQASAIREILLSCGVLDRVQLGGHVTHAEVPRWYRKADLFISPSHVDGSSVSLMEALASGLPALVSDIPANREWVREDVNGWLFPDGNAQTLAEKILSVSLHKKALVRTGRAARRVAEERADWTKNFRVLLEAYDLARQSD